VKIKDIDIRLIKLTDYNDIYLLNQDFNTKFSLFSAEKVKERIEFIIKNLIGDTVRGTQRFSFVAYMQEFLNSLHETLVNIQFIELDNIFFYTICKS